MLDSLVHHLSRAVDAKGKSLLADGDCRAEVQGDVDELARKIQRLDDAFSHQLRINDIAKARIDALQAIIESRNLGPLVARLEAVEASLLVLDGLTTRLKRLEDAQTLRDTFLG